MLDEIKQPIPHFYEFLANGDRSLFKRYVQAYIKHNYVGYELVRIESKGKVAVVRKV